VVLPVKRSAFSRMVSGLRSTSVTALSLRLGFLGLLSGLAGLVFSGCSKSECLREDCQSSAPEDSAAGGPAVAGAPGQSSAGASSSVPIGKKCSSNSECAADQGQACAEGTCRLACSSHFDCQGFGECARGLDADGLSAHFCELGQRQKPGQFYTRCASGTECDATNDFFCMGAGTDDLDAYCTRDCTEGDDTTCAPGYACGPLTRAPCQDICNLKGNAKDRQCVPSDQIGEGKPFQCGSRGVTRNVCRPRKFCSPCESDADCLGIANQVCARDESGGKTCTQLCDLKHPSCPWGTAAECGFWDADLKRATCQHRFRKCTGTGKSCEPCLTDADCGARGACNASSFTGERWCVDLRVTCSCGSEADANGLCSGGGCPDTPGGLRMLCSDSTPSVPDSGVCVGAYTSSALDSSPQTGCWPAD
jgi:hypothetical protein